MHIRDIWGRVNISTLLVLPIFSELTRNVYAFRSKIKFPLVQLCYEYGLLQTYLYNDLQRNATNCLHLVFDREKCMKSMKMTSSLYHSMNELLIDYRQFHRLGIYNQCIIYSIKVPKRWLSDVKKIEDGKYSAVSKEYKEMLRIKDRFPTFPFVKNQIGHFIVEKNLPYAIVMKAPKLKEDIENIIGNEIPSSQEYFDRMDPRREILTPKAFENIWQRDPQVIGI